MDDAFDQLDQAAVAGAEGTAWPIPDLSSVASLPPPGCFDTFDAFDADDTSDTAVAVMSHFHSSSAISAPIPIPSASSPPPKIEPIVDAFMPDVPASPITPLLCSVGSSASTHPSRAFVPVRQPRKRRATCESLSTSPTSIAIPPAKSQVASSSPSSLPSSTSHPLPLAKSPVSSDAAMRDASPSPSPSPTTSFSAHDLTDLSGTTAARSRKMTEEERKIMLHKRRLRNRASAARSREKRSRTLNDLTCEVEDLMLKSARLAQQASQALEEARKLRAKNVMLAKENELLKSELKL